MLYTLKSLPKHRAHGGGATHAPGHVDQAQVASKVTGIQAAEGQAKAQACRAGWGEGWGSCRAQAASWPPTTVKLPAERPGRQRRFGRAEVMHGQSTTQGPAFRRPARQRQPFSRTQAPAEQVASSQMRGVPPGGLRAGARGGRASAPAMRKRLPPSMALKAAPKDAPGGAVSRPSPSPRAPPVPSPLDPASPPPPSGAPPAPRRPLPPRAGRARRPPRAPDVVNPNCHTESTMPSGMPPPWSDSLQRVCVCVFRCVRACACVCPCMCVHVCLLAMTGLAAAFLLQAACRGQIGRASLLGAAKCPRGPSLCSWQIARPSCRSHPACTARQPVGPPLPKRSPCVHSQPAPPPLPPPDGDVLLTPAQADMDGRQPGAARQRVGD